MSLYLSNTLPHFPAGRCRHDVHILSKIFFSDAQFSGKYSMQLHQQAIFNQSIVLYCAKFIDWFKKNGASMQ